MDKLNALKYFCSAAETLQFREIALRLSVSPQVVTRVIAELEQHLGEQLFTRNTRNIHLTEFGAAFLPRAQQLLADSENLFSAAREKDEIRGIVRITVPQWNDNGRILARLLEKCADYPELYIDWRSNDAKLNAVENQLDIGIRIGTQAEDLMIVRKICDTTDKIVASPAYLARHGTPQSPDDLARHQCLHFLHGGRVSRWRFQQKGKETAFQGCGRFSADNGEALLELALSAFGIVQLPHYLVQTALDSGSLKSVLSDFQPKPVPVMAVYPSRKQLSPKVRALVDMMGEAWGKAV